MPSLVLTGEQIRAGRALGRVEQSELAKLAGVSLETVKRLERIRGAVDANVRTLNAISAAFEQLGISFNAGGVAIGGPKTAGASLSSDRNYAGEADEPPVYRMIYYSTAVDIDNAGLAAIVVSLSQVAKMAGVTGFLFVCNNRFVHLFEGDKDIVLQLYTAVTVDPRHRDIRVIQAAEVGSRLFDIWAGYDKIMSHNDLLFCDEPCMKGDFHPDLLSPASAVGLVSMVRDEYRNRARIAMRQSRLA